MIIKIKGLKDESYKKKDEKGTVVEQIRIYFEKEKVDGIIGVLCGSELITSRHCPTAVDELFQLGEQAIGKSAILSKDTSTFNGNSYSFVDEFEIVK